MELFKGFSAGTLASFISLLLFFFCFNSPVMAAESNTMIEIPYLVRGEPYSLTALVPNQLEVKADCATISVVLTPPPLNFRNDVDLEVQLINRETSDTSDTTILSSASKTWGIAAGMITSKLSICGLDASSGVKNSIDLMFRVISTKANGQENVAYVSHGLTLLGASKSLQIVCVLGNKAKVVSSVKPQCPFGWSKKNLPIVNGKVATTTISCAKGLQVKRVTAVFPSCPAGFKRQ